MLTKCVCTFVEPYESLNRALIEPLQEHCEIALLGGKLVCCDGCPASYRKESVGLKRVSHGEDDKWFCEECRVGGQIRTYRYLHRYADAVEWTGRFCFACECSVVYTICCGMHTTYGEATA